MKIPRPLGMSQVHLHQVPGVPGERRIGIVTGDIRRARCAQVWVNPENTEMRMARIDERSISAIIRYEGARRDAAGRVTADLIADELDQRVGALRPVAAGTVVITGPGELARFGVRHITHTAAVQGEPGAGYRQVQDIGRCISMVLDAVDQLPGPAPVESVLFPLLGAGQGGGDPAATADALVGVAVADLDWYHTIDLPGGVTTPGYFDLREVVGKVPIPPSLAGKRCLDVASADGFFAFELARRGGQVVSVDLADTTRQDWQGPPGANAERAKSTGRADAAFELCRDALGYDIERHDLSVYDMSPERLGSFDYVFMGNVLLHLGDPGRALRALRSVLRPDGEFCSFEGIALFLSVVAPRMPVAQLWHTDDARWWTHNKAGHRRLVEAGGFRVVAQNRGVLFAPFGPFIPRWPTGVPRGAREALFWLWVRRMGFASSWVRATRRTLEGADEAPEP